MSTARFSAQELLRATSGRALRPLPPEGAFSLTSDSRAIAPQSWFVPLAGERFDGHDFLADAARLGAAGAFISEARASVADSLPESLALIAVPDPLMAYLDAAAAYRRRLGDGLTALALTGSSGKTTVKEMLAAAFAPLMPTQATARNFNNEIGVCQTLLATEAHTRLLIVEMGMRGLNQIRPLSCATQPDIALVTNIGPAHLGMLGSMAAIAQAKCEIFEGLKPDGLAIVHGDDSLLRHQAARVWKGRLEAFSLQDACDRSVSADGGQSFIWDGCRITLGEAGDHRILNALAVLTVGRAMGYQPSALQPALQAFRAPDGRGGRQAIAGLTNAWVVNDAYNANPASMCAGLQAFLQTPVPAGMRRALALGAMKELGPEARALHEALGVWLAEAPGIDLLMTFGEEAAWTASAAQAAGASFPIRHTAQEPPPADALARGLRECGIALRDVSIFLKGSRACRLETLIDGLCADAAVPCEEPACL
ncbi:MAG: UDP-N-acetylmuramoyl-tripeptide--D-alanyl-D-alanine ligase [Vampirovibrionales bacterium]|nr:UDP-N-acetylmuramoyl-tripeptide--D-alanyl-D-alanine ligase [Vampirovibrionales bacterium]